MKSNVRKYQEQIELAFWMTVIPAMKESHPFGAAFQGVYGLIGNQAWVKGLVKALAAASLGLAIGFTLGIFRSL